MSAAVEQLQTQICAQPLVRLLLQFQVWPSGQTYLVEKSSQVVSFCEMP